MFKIILIGLLAVVVGILFLATTKPDNFSVQRSAVMTAPPAKIFALINDFHLWGGWSPWEHRDPAMQRTFGGTMAGRGSSYAWEGNSEVRAGRMEITASDPDSSIATKLDFIRPITGHNIPEFTLEPNGGVTKVTWAMHGPSPFISKLMQVFFSMDKMIGKDFEAGLANMKGLAEKP